MNVLLELFWSFVKIGFTSFGGISMVPLINSEMISHGWMTAEEVTDILAIAEMTPGPNGYNCATFAGLRTAGIPGALAANLGVLMPAVTLCALAAKFYESFRKNHRMQQVMIGVRPASVGMILGLTVSLCMENYGAAGGGVSLPAAALGALDLFLLLKCKMSIPAVIGISAAGGLLLFGVLGL